MKKLILSLFLVTGLSFVVNAADQRGTPRDVTGTSVHEPGFVGVSYSTSSFSILTTTVTYSTQTVRGSYTVFGVNFTTGACYSHVDLFDSVETVASQGNPTFRVYNVAGSTGVTAVPGGICAGYSPIGEPVRFQEGLLFKPSTALFNKISVLYYKEGDE